MVLILVDYKYQHVPIRQTEQKNTLRKDTFIGLVETLVLIGQTNFKSI